jgi:integrase/recombinase XerD
MSETDDLQGSLNLMRQYMKLRGLKPNTVSTFTRCARSFLAHVGKAPAETTTDDVREFLLRLAGRGRAPRTRNVNLAAVRCLLTASLGRASRTITADIPNAKVQRRCPEILSGSEVARLLDATDSPKYRAIFMLAYGAGLRVSEITSLRISDIDSKRMLLHVPEGKTGPRHVMLSPLVLSALRNYWKVARPQGPELFPGGRKQRPGTRLTRESIHKVLAQVGRKAGIKKRVHPHMLRHYAESPVMPSCLPSDAGIARIPGAPTCGTRHNQRLCRKARSSSSGRKRAGRAVVGTVLASARSLSSRLATK